MSRLRWVVVRWLFALATLVVAAPSATAAPPAELFGSDLAGLPPIVRSRSAEFRFQGPDEFAAAPRWDGGKGPRESIAPGAAAPLEGQRPAFAGNAPGESIDANEDGVDDATGLEIDPDALEPGHEGPGMRPLRCLLGCFGPVHDGRYRDAGHPLDRESWQNRPLGVGLFAGSLAADDLSSNLIVAGTGFFGGVRFGWDYSYFGGFETRLGWTKVALGFPQNPTIVGDGNFLLWDANWLYYPWGDTQWRPFFLVGLGLVDMKFINDQGLRDHDTVFGLPLGIGFKYRWDARLAFRFDIIDNIAFAAGNGLDDMSHFSFTGGLEWRFGGGTRRSYWPWNASRETW
jgi:Outer membrane protein beta-barrel domain